MPRSVRPLRNSQDVERHLLLGDAPTNRLLQLIELGRRALRQKALEQALVRTQRTPCIRKLGKRGPGVLEPVRRSDIRPRIDSHHAVSYARVGADVTQLTA